jgi:DNA repair protein RecO (recombination protein O)
MTEEMGKIGVLARGARKSQKRFGGALETFALFEATMGRRRGNLWPLSEAILLTAYSQLARDLDRVKACAFILELVREVTSEQQPGRRLFAFVQEMLSLASKFEGEALERVAIGSVLKVLELSGTGVAADHCNACGTPVPRGKKVLFNASRGGVVCTPCGGGPFTLSSQAVAALIDASVLPLESLATKAMSAESVAELKSALSEFLDYHLDRPLRTKSFF